ncbi:MULTISPECIES: pantoate--beta-alanine ligase [unclassified Paracoccus (in: a-proteobacteria)]|uniref:pantoate--beta-alanine ligase n=1 Tax=unclassified Paracoccus (in: a-proteobacteria) TaxID=2688777 RepID=UPI0012B294BB|nr:MULTISPECIES: pantoate--beta-alanine ligase [unclassified Paracoccus (in: a-proteobacteria)]UXU76450.1 pantoate--beta-alanine ligase [Paracoccus sp. SMMA_5]UXU82212.1 pantoate--beta-alanine ligase [Paracoccus sp. SMMA_5_TC]
MTTPIIRSTAQLRALVRDWKSAGQTIAVVPTMGALHEGHLSLVRAARQDCDRVIVTLFVNPRQFNSPEDYAKYPRTEQADAALLGPLAVDALFVPDGDGIYPPGHASTVSVTGVTEPLEGAHRPGHFDGVATVVTILFNLTQADRAYFGEKDWQQLQLVRRLVSDLHLPLQVVPCACVRDADGLALSSRNQRLSAQGRALAAALPQALFRAADEIAAGAAVDQALDAARARITAAGLGPVEYLELRDAESLGPPVAGQPRRLLVAVWLEGVRLIDNVAVPAPG